MDVADAKRFNGVVFRLLSDRLKVGWWLRPFRGKCLRAMEAYTKSPASHQWFDDAGNFLWATTVYPYPPQGGSAVVVDMRRTLEAWVAGFRQDADFWVALILELVLEWLLDNLTAVAAVLENGGVFADGVRVAAWDAAQV